MNRHWKRWLKCLRVGVFPLRYVGFTCLLFFGCNTVMSLVETRSRDKNILRYCHPKKCIPLCIDRAVNTPFYDVVFVFNPFAAGATVVLISGK